MTDKSTKITKRQETDISKRPQKRQTVEELDLSQNTNDTGVPTVASKEVAGVAQTIITGAVEQADQLSKLEVETFAKRVTDNVEPTTKAKVKIADQVFTTMTNLWVDSMLG